MKKLSTLALAAAGMFMSTVAMAQDPIVVEADNASKITTALTADYQPGQVVYIKITSETATSIQNFINLKNVNLPARGNIHLVGITNEDGTRPCIGAEMILPKDQDEEGNEMSNTEGDKFSLHFENLILKDYNGVGGNSKHFMNAKDHFEHHIDTLEFQNCEIADICRSFYRMEPNASKAPNSEFPEGYSGPGTLNTFIMENCKFHYGSTQSNAMPLIYMSQSCGEMKIRNNTFYDLPYLNSIVTFAYMTDDFGRTAIDALIENNTICARSKGTLFSFGNYVSMDSKLTIKNNVFFRPYWSDDLNNIDLSEDSIQNIKQQNIAGIQYGLVDVSNNLLQGYKGAMADLDEEGNGEWITGEEVNDLTLDDLNLDFADFTDWEDDNFLIGKEGDNLSAFYTAGTGNQPIGDTNNFTDEVVVFVKITPVVAGSRSAKIIMLPDQPSYQAGSIVKLIANTNGKLNVFKNWSNGETNDTIEIVVPSEGLTITANFEELPYIAAWNLEQLDKNNVKLDAPLAPNYGDENIMLCYATWHADEVAYADSLTSALMTRNNKVSGDLRNCFFIHTAPETFALANVEDAEDKGHADYAYINIPEAKAGSQLWFSVATDNVSYKNYAVSYSIDGGASWTDIAVFEMNESGKWADKQFTLPAEVNGKPTYVRIKGVEADGWYSQGFIDGGHEISEVAYEFLFLSEFYLMNGDDMDGISETATTSATPAASRLYNLMGQQVSATARGLLIKGGKKYLVK